MTEEKALREQRDMAYKKVTRTFRKFNVARKLFRDLEKRFLFEKKEYENLDRDLAMVDGRYQRLAEAIEERKKTATASKLVAKFTTGQIIRIAEALGVDLEVEGK